MQPWAYEIGDILLIERKGEEVVARVAGYTDRLDNTKSLYVSLRNVDNTAWKRSTVKVQPAHIKGEDKDWYARQHARWDAELKASVDAIYAKMTPAEKRRLSEQAMSHRQRSPLDIMIDRACGLE